MKIIPIRETGGGRAGSLYASYAVIVAHLGEPNCTDLDDSWKVKASWGFKDEKGRKAFIWCYKADSAEGCRQWSLDGDKGLLVDLFGSSRVEMR